MSGVRQRKKKQRSERRKHRRWERGGDGKIDGGKSRETRDVRDIGEEVKLRKGE